VADGVELGLESDVARSARSILTRALRAEVEVRGMPSKVARTQQPAGNEQCEHEPSAHDEGTTGIHCDKYVRRRGWPKARCSHRHTAEDEQKDGQSEVAGAIEWIEADREQGCDAKHEDDRACDVQAPR